LVSSHPFPPVLNKYPTSKTISGAPLRRDLIKVLSVNDATNWEKKTANAEVLRQKHSWQHSRYSKDVLSMLVLNDTEIKRWNQRRGKEN